MDIASSALIPVFATFCGVVIFRIVTGGVNIAGLLYPDNGSEFVAPERLQALIMTLAVPIGYALYVISEGRGNPEVSALPDVPEWVLSLTLASHTLFLGGKIARE